MFKLQMAQNVIEYVSHPSIFNFQQIIYSVSVVLYNHIFNQNMYYI